MDCRRAPVEPPPEESVILKQIAGDYGIEIGWESTAVLGKVGFPGCETFFHRRDLGTQLIEFVLALKNQEKIGPQIGPGVFEHPAQIICFVPSDFPGIGPVR